MRTSLLGMLCAAALLSGALATPATAATTRVDGDRLGKSGLRVASHGCEDTRAAPITEPTLRIKRGPGNPPLGDHSVGWTMPGTTYGVGPTARIKSPKSLKAFRVSVYVPGRAMDARAVATYRAPNDTGVWKGIAHVGPSSAKGWTTVNARNAVFTWNHFVGDTIDRTDPDNTLVGMATRHGGNGKGAWVGFLFGCGGETFYVDGLEVATAKEHKVYDLGGYLSMSDILWGSVVRKKITITYGQRLALNGRLRMKSNLSTMDAPLRIDGKRAGAKHWAKYAAVRTGETFKVHPARNTSYRSVYAGAEKYERSTWRPLSILVRSVVRAGLVDPTVTKGKIFTVAGRVLPQRSSTVLLQRYLNKKWTTIKKGRSGSEGRYRVSLTAKSTGTSYWRVVVNKGGGNLGNHSKQMKLTVSKPASSGGGGGGTYDPPPPPDDPPPPTEPPPPSH